MISDLDAALESLLAQDLPAVTISFDPPDSTFAPSLPAVNLFLYDVRENRDLRDNAWTMDRSAGSSATLHPPPVRVDCSYLVTAWSSDARNEHLLLSQVVLTLLRYPVLPSGVLQGALADQEPPLPATALTPGHLQGMGEFWQALGGKPKAAVNYTATLRMDPAETVVMPLVLEKTIELRTLGRST